MRGGFDKRPSPSTEVAYAAVMCALLIGGQYIFSFVAGVEIVTLLLLCFSCEFGVRQGVFCAVAFSLLRCFVFGFYPSVIILYLIYFPLFAALFGALGTIGREVFARPPFAFVIAVNVLTFGIAAVCGAAALLDWISVSRLLKTTVTVCLWLVFGLAIALGATFDALLLIQKQCGKDYSRILRVIAFTTCAALCTVSFSLLDDAITPLFYGYSRSAALAYFYGSFVAMLPQTVCTIVTVGLLFLPVTSLLDKVKGKKR